MKFAITKEISEIIIKNGVSDMITDLSVYLGKFLEQKSYGSGLETFYIGIICVAPEFDFFFKVRKPKYKRGKEIFIQDGREYEQINALTYDIKLNYEEFIDKDLVVSKELLKAYILDSFTLIDSIKIPLFEKSKFIMDASTQIRAF